MKLTSEESGLLRSFGEVCPPDADLLDLLASLKPCSLNGMGLPRVTDAQAGTRVAVLRGMLRLSLTLSGSERQLQQLVRALRSLSIGTRIKQGCLGCRVCLENDGEGRSVQYVEMWATEPDIRRHIRSDHFTSILALMESSREAPDLRFDFIAATRGLDYVAEVRDTNETAEAGTSRQG